MFGNSNTVLSNSTIGVERREDALPIPHLIVDLTRCKVLSYIRSITPSALPVGSLEQERPLAIRPS